MVQYIKVHLLSFLLLLCTVCSSQSADRIRVAVVQETNGTPLQRCLEGFQHFFRETSLEPDFSLYQLHEGLANAEEVITQIRTVDPQVVLVLGSRPVKTVCQALAGDLVIIGVSLRKEDLECAGNVGGVYLEYPPEIQLEWMQRILPWARNVGVIYSSEHNRKKIADVSPWAKQRGVTILKREISAPYQISAALSDLGNRADVLWGISDSIVLTPGTVRKMLLFSFRNKVPFVGLSKAWGKAGALYALDRDYTDIGRQCAEMAYAEIRGQEGPPLLPQPPRQVRYFLNLKTAHHLKIDLSAALIQGAEESY